MITSAYGLYKSTEQVEATLASLLELKIVQPYFAKMLTTLVHLWSEKDKDKVDFLICHARHCQQYSAQKLAALT